MISVGCGLVRFRNLCYAMDLSKEVLVGASQQNLLISDVRFLPMVCAYASKIGLVEEIDRLLDCDMEVSPGRVVLAMIMDALSGRRPLFRLREFFADKDVELVLGEDIPPVQTGRSYPEESVDAAVRCGDKHRAGSYCAQGRTELFPEHITRSSRHYKPFGLWRLPRL